jgi:hypothetical protein
VTPN